MTSQVNRPWNLLGLPVGDSSGQTGCQHFPKTVKIHSKHKQVLNWCRKKQKQSLHGNFWHCIDLPMSWLPQKHIFQKRPEKKRRFLQGHHPVFHEVPGSSRRFRPERRPCQMRVAMRNWKIYNLNWWLTKHHLLKNRTKILPIFDGNVLGSYYSYQAVCLCSTNRFRQNQCRFNRVIIQSACNPRPGFTKSYINSKVIFKCWKQVFFEKFSKQII